MEAFPISEILTNFIVAAVILYMSDRERKILLDRLEALEEKHDNLQRAYQDDLRDWAGLDPKFKTWANRPPLESDTKIRAYMLSKEEREEAEKRMTE